MIISEHEQIEKEDKSLATSYSPSDEERKVLRLVEKLFGKSRRWRSNYDKKWMDYYKMFRGQQWKEQRPSYRHSEVINLVFQAIQSSVPIITDVRPRWEYQAQEPTDREFADLMNTIAEADWIRNNWLMQLTEIIYDAHFYGTGFGGMYYDPEKRPMDGDICFDSVDPYSVYPDPSARDVNKNSDFVIKAEPVDIQKIKHEYPDKGQFVQPDVVDAVRSERTDLEPLFQLRLPIDETKSLRDSAGGVEGQLENKCLKKTCYMKSYETVTEETVDENGMPQKVTKLKYPNGRKIVIAGGVVLEDVALEYEDGKFPYARCVNYILPREFWGISEIEQLESPQKMFNKLISFTLDVLTLMGNPIWVVDDEAGVDEDNIINSPGLIITKNKNGEVRREEGVQLQPYVLQIVDRLKEYFVGIAGTAETSPPPGVTAAAAIQDLQEAGQTRIRLKSRNLDAFLQDMGQMYLSRVLQYRTVPTVVRLTGDQSAQQYFKFHVKPVMDESGSQAFDERGNPMRTAVVQQMGPDGGYTQQKEIPIKGSLDVKVSTGSTMPFMKAQKTRQAMDLFKLGAIDQEELLKATEWANWQVVLERMKQAAQQQQEAQMQQQMAQGATQQQKPTV
jgi:hypothetical protein